jgi:hypothetical protein
MLVYAQENDCTIAGWNVQFDVQWLIAYGLEDEFFYSQRDVDDIGDCVGTA